MMLDDFRNTKSLPYLRAWSSFVLHAIGTGTNTFAKLIAACEQAVQAGTLPRAIKLESEIRQTLKRLGDRSRVSYSRRTGVWSVM